MSASSRITQSGAFGNEFSGTGVDVHNGWGTDAPLKPLSIDAGFPYLTFEHDPEPVLERDTSVTSKAFQTGEREVGRTLDKSLSFNNRCDGMDKQLSWMTGWENKTKKVIVFQTNRLTDAPAGTVFSTDGEDYTFLRQYQAKTITNKVIFYAVFSYLLDNAPDTQAGTLDQAGAFLDLTYIGWDKMYEHTYELSNDGRAFRAFTASERTALGNQATVDDRRTCMATLAKKFPEYSFRFQNTKCYKFGFKWAPQKFTEVMGSWLGYDQERIKTTDPLHSDIDYDMLCSMVESNNIFAHNQTRFEIGVASTKYNGGNYTFYPVTEMNVDVEVPLQKQQDTESGLFLTDPVLNGLIAISAGATITHSKDEQFMEWRDNRTKLAGVIRSSYGFYSQEIFLKKFTLPKAGPDGGEVSAEPITLSVELTCGGHAFDQYFTDDVMGSPMVIRVVNKNPYNEMTGRDLAGLRRA